MIFLSASIPDPERNQKYFDTADIIAIRDSVRALATVVTPNSPLVWGGHPAITPLMRYVMNTMKVNVSQNMILYQSGWFVKSFPPDNSSFEKVVIIPANESREASLLDMRRAMLENYFKVGIFIGGMEGVEEEYKLFRKLHPQALTFPIASTGGAAKLIYDSTTNVESRLLNDFAYMALFRYLLTDIL